MVITEVVVADALLTEEVEGVVAIITVAEEGVNPYF
jgi:hypothetical protein